MEQMAPRQDLPFQKVWFKQGVDFKRYKSIFIPAVHTGFLLQSNWWQQNFRQGQMQEDLATMAQYMRDEFKTAFAYVSFPLVSGGGGPAARFPDP